jgi:signal transduction histidine kinase
MGGARDSRAGGPWFRVRIGQRLVLSFVLLVMLVVGGSGYVLYHMTLTSLQRQLRAQLLGAAGLVAQSLHGDVLRRLRVGDEAYPLHQRLTARLTDARNVVGAARISVFDPAGRALLDTEPGWPIGRGYPHLAIRDRAEMQRVLAGQPTCSVLFYQQGVPYMTGYAPIYLGDEVVAAVGVDIGAGFVDTIRLFGRSVLAFAALGALVTVGLALWLARTITRPVQALVRAARAIGRGNLQVAVVAPSRDELGYLGETMEEMRRQLVARDAQLRQMLGGVAHEIRNPLGGIEIYAGLIASDLPETDPRRTHIHKVIEEVRKLNGVITEFLDFARPRPPSPRLVTTAHLIDQARFLLAPEMDKAHVELQLDVPPDLEVYVDPQQLQRALFNLMKNGVQAMRQGGALAVTARGETEQVVIAITDTGVGMGPEVMARLFEPFFTTREKGSGLGMAIVSRILDENRGSIEMHSEEGRGTTCRVRLPRRPAADLPAEAA